MGLVERDDLVAQLRAIRPGALVAVSGEAGAGKTSLVTAALAGAQWGWCDPSATPRPMGPFRDLGHSDDPLVTGDRVLELMREAPLVLVIEDCHWIDDASADVLRFLGRRIATTQGTIVLTHRDEITPDHPLRRVLGDLATSSTLTRIVVPPLTPDAVATLLDGTDLDVAEAVRRTGGNAFLVAQLAESPDLAPTSLVRDAVAARLGRLSRRARDLVELLSVVPGHVPLRAVAHREDALDAAESAGLLVVAGDRVRFRHELVRLAVEQQLTRDGVRRRNAEALDLLSGGADAEPGALATHARRAGLDRIAFVAEVEAGDLARAAGAHRHAAEHYRRALDDEVATGAELARLWLALAAEQFVIGQDRAAFTSAGRASELSRDHPLLHGETVRLLGRYAPDAEQAQRFARQAVALLEPLGDTPELAHAQALVATNLMLARDLEAAITASRPAIELALRVGAADAEVSARQALGSALVLTGRDADGSELRLALRIAHESGRHDEAGRAWANLVSAAGEARQYALSDEATAEALAYFTARDLDAWAGYTHAWAARCLFEQGRWADATAQVDLVLVDAPSQSRITVLTALTTQGRIRARRGDPGVAESLDAAGVLADESGSLQRLAPVAAARAEAGWLAGRAAEGAGGLRRAYDLALERRNPWAVGELGHWLRRLRLLESLPAYAAAPYLLHAHGDHHGAAMAWLELGCPYEAADALADSDDEADLQQALELLDRLGARPLRLRTARRLRELGVRSVPRGPRAAAFEHAHGLTAREQEVLGWLESGASDADIAAALHLSVKTVGHHVSSVLHKTGSTSRRELDRRPR